MNQHGLVYTTSFETDGNTYTKIKLALQRTASASLTRARAVDEMELDRPLHLQALPLLSRGFRGAGSGIRDTTTGPPKQNNVRGGQQPPRESATDWCAADSVSYFACGRPTVPAPFLLLKYALIC